MDTELQAIRDAWDKDTGDGRDTATVTELSRAYVESHPEHFLDMHGKTLPECVESVEGFRTAGWSTFEQRAQVWLWATFPPQTIGGTFGQEG